VLKHWEASRAAYNFVLLPPLTLFFSHYITGEDVGVELIVGGLLILIGVYIGALRPGVSGPGGQAPTSAAPKPQSELREAG
jgi:drug/metabolite transporter (DMT)-like permease